MGTGVPFTFKKWMSDQQTKNTPKANNIKDRTFVQVAKLSVGKFKLLSIRIAAMTKRLVKILKIIAPTGVSKVLTFLVLLEVL